MELAAPLLQLGGKLICYKANLKPSELDHALLLQDTVGLKLVSDRSFVLDDYQRRIVTFEKVKRESIQLPRKTGLAQKRPL